MKKLFILSALSLAMFSFANSPTTKSLKANLIKEKKVQKKISRSFYIVSFTDACGSPITVGFFSDYPDGSSAFISDLANAVNKGYAFCTGNVDMGYD